MYILYSMLKNEVYMILFYSAYSVSLLHLEIKRADKLYKACWKELARTLLKFAGQLVVATAI